MNDFCLAIHNLLFNKLVVGYLDLFMAIKVVYLPGNFFGDIGP
jgi:hypothetical protein